MITEILVTGETYSICFIFLILKSSFFIKVRRTDVKIVTVQSIYLFLLEILS